MLGTPLHRYDEVDSTMDIVASLARGDAPEGTAVIAERQRKGRGRQNRAWFSPPGGNVYLSVLLRPAMTAAEISALAPACGLGVAQALEEFVPVRAQFKWPNDIVVRGRKIAGILTESFAQGWEVGYIVVGVGVNLNVESFPEHLVNTATSVRLETGASVDREGFVLAVFRHLNAVYQRYLAGGFADLAEAWNTRDALRGQQVRLNTGAEILQGTARGISPSGALVLETSAGLQQVSIGEVLEML
jgi:BirA family transcriptional regulator, biotin operon repressor / biotin---[acetyl-CoA-carboxylase] ligase